MPIRGHGWEIFIQREMLQTRSSDGKVRTVGSYQVFNNGVAVGLLAGTTAESRGLGSNSEKGRRIAAGIYPIATQDGGKYATIGYNLNANQTALRRPDVELRNTGSRSEILIHPGIGFLASIGCINLCRFLPDASEPNSFDGSRTRVIAVIDNIREFLGVDFPTKDGRPIPNAFDVIDGEP